VAVTDVLCMVLHKRDFDQVIGTYDSSVQEYFEMMRAKIHKYDDDDDDLVSSASNATDLHALPEFALPHLDLHKLACAEFACSTTSMRSSAPLVVSQSTTGNVMKSSLRSKLTEIPTRVSAREGEACAQETGLRSLGRNLISRNLSWAETHSETLPVSVSVDVLQGTQGLPNILPPATFKSNVSLLKHLSWSKHISNTLLHPGLTPPLCSLPPSLPRTLARSIARSLVAADERENMWWLFSLAWLMLSRINILTDAALPALYIALFPSLSLALGVGGGTIVDAWVAIHL